MGSIGPTELVVLAIFLGLVAAAVIVIVLVVRSVTRTRAPQLVPTPRHIGLRSRASWAT